MTADTTQTSIPISPRFQDPSHIFEVAEHMARDLAKTSPRPHLLNDGKHLVYPVSYNKGNELAVGALKMATKLAAPSIFITDPTIPNTVFFSFARESQKPPVRQIRAKLETLKQELARSFHLEPDSGNYRFIPTADLKPLQTDIFLKQLSENKPSVQFYYAIPKGVQYISVDSEGKRRFIKGVVPEETFDMVSKRYQETNGSTFEKSACFSSALIAHEVMLPLQNALGLLPEKGGSRMTSASVPSRARH